MKHINICTIFFVSTLAACGDVPQATQSEQAPGLSRQGRRLLGAVQGRDFEATGNAYYDIQDFGDELRNNKGYLVQILQGQQASLSDQVLVVAMAMQETNHMSPDERDASKDGTPSANISILNLNIDMVRAAGYNGSDDGVAMNNQKNLGLPVWYLLHAVNIWGLSPTLNFQRGGRTAFEDGVSYGAADYRNSIATIYNAISNDISLLTDSRRVVVDLDHVF